MEINKKQIQQTNLQIRNKFVNDIEKIFAN